MKYQILTFVFILISSLNGYSQYWKEIPGSCGIKHKCSARVHYDAFEKTNLIVAGNNAEIGGGKPNDGTASIMFKKMVSENIIIFYAEFDSNDALGYKGCTMEGKSYISILFDDGEKITLQSVDKITCGTTKINALLTEKDIAALLDKNISQMRMNFVDGPIDFVAKGKQTIKFKELLNCVVNVKL